VIWIKNPIKIQLLLLLFFILGHLIGGKGDNGQLIFQLDYGVCKLHFNEMMMISALH
jgi:hypothetical protein